MQNFRLEKIVSRFAQKTNQPNWFFAAKSEKAKKNKFAHSTFGRIYGLPICSLFYLTFSGNCIGGHCISRGIPVIMLAESILAVSVTVLYFISSFLTSISVRPRTMCFFPWDFIITSCHLSLFPNFPIWTGHITFFNKNKSLQLLLKSEFCWHSWRILIHLLCLVKKLKCRELQCHFFFLIKKAYQQRIFQECEQLSDQKAAEVS